jgi:tetratricopeptide (TPR) repeat protein
VIQRYTVSEASTQSDDDIQHMMPDLVPSEVAEVEEEEPQFRDAQSPIPKVSDEDYPSPLTSTNDVYALNQLAMDHVHNGEYDMALRAFSRVLQIQRQEFGDIHPAVASAHHNLGTLHAKRAALLFDGSAQQRHVRALALASFQAAARTARDSLGRNHPNVAVSLVRIGFLLLQSRQYQNAIITFKEALRIRLTHYGAQHGLVANLYNNLGVCHMHLSQFESGRQYLDAALDIQRDTVQVGDKTDRLIHQLELADTLFNIGGLCLEWIRQQGPDTRRAVDAEEAFAEALEVRRCYVWCVCRVL